MFRLTNFFIATLLTAFLSGVCVAQTIRFVNVDATPGGDGMSWETAYINLFDALDEAAIDSLIEQIWVAQGTYTPDRGQGNQNDSFFLVNDLDLYGGFDGTEDQLDDRDPLKNPTILSGDFNGDDEVIPAEGEVPNLPVFLNYEEGKIAGRVLRGWLD